MYKSGGGAQALVAITSMMMTVCQSVIRQKKEGRGCGGGSDGSASKWKEGRRIW